MTMSETHHVRFAAEARWPELELSTAALVPLPDDPRRWEDEALRNLGARDARTLRGVTGWPMRLLVERDRLVALFRFLDHGATVVVTGPPEALARHRDEIVAHLRTAWPDWSGEIAAEHQLWEGIDWR